MFSAFHARGANAAFSPEDVDIAASAAACNLFSENSVDGMRAKEDIEKMVGVYGWGEL